MKVKNIIKKVCVILQSVQCTVKDKFNIVLLIMIINMQSFYLLPIWKSTITISVMFVFLLVNFKTFNLHMKIYKYSIFELVAWSAMLMFVAADTLINNSFLIFLKLVVYISVAIVSSKIEGKVLLAVFNGTIIYNLLYSFYIIRNATTINLQMWGQRKYTYITVTFTVGLSLTMALIGLAKEQLFSKKLYYFLCVCIYILAISNYSARGNALFPFVIIGLIFLLEMSIDYKRFLFSILGLGALVGVGVLIIYYFKDTILVARLLSAGVNDESRVIIWKDYISYMKEHFRWLLGVGVTEMHNIFEYSYPHNFMIEIFVTNGIFALIVAAITFVVRPFWNILQVCRRKNYSSLILFIIAGFLYIFISYLKSGSIYDAYLLFVFTGWTIRKIEL